MASEPESNVAFSIRFKGILGVSEWIVYTTAMTQSTVLCFPDFGNTAQNLYLYFQRGYAF